MNAPDQDVFHAGERAVQERAGVREVAAELGAGMIQPVLRADFAAFLTTQSVLYLSAADADGRVWVTALAGPPGVARALAADRVRIGTVPQAGDPLAAILAAGPTQAGVLVLEAGTRSRIRLNGTVTRQDDDTLSLTLTEAFGNCPKYIARRHPVARATVPARSDAPVARGATLTPDEQELILGADTFFIGSRQAERGADASHRGGRPGFVTVAPDGASLTFPDYAGNNMFQTLGNLTSDPAVGLLFIDWASGRTVQITGRASIDWDSPRIARWPRAQRLVDVQIAAVVDRPAGLPIIWAFDEASKVNPPAPT